MDEDKQLEDLRRTVDRLKSFKDGDEPGLALKYVLRAVIIMADIMLAERDENTLADTPPGSE